MSNSTTFFNQELIDGVPTSFFQELREWLGKPGCRWFRCIYNLHKDISPVLRLNAKKRFIPVHSVHSNQGMQIRNFMRDFDHFREWDAHMLDDNWGEITRIAVFEEK